MIHGNRLPVKIKMESCFEDVSLKPLTDKEAVRFDAAAGMVGSPLLEFKGDN